MSAISPDEQSIRSLGSPAGTNAGGDDGTLIDDPAVRPPLVLGDRDFHSVTDTICGWAEKRPPLIWYPLMAISNGFAGLIGVAILYLIITGVGVWGLNNPVDWGWAIVNFVWWVGIGHAGTLISAILCIFKQKWRT